MSDMTSTLDTLNKAYNMKSRSLAQYLAHARPYVRPGLGDALKELQAIAQTDQQQALRLEALIEDYDGIPYPSPWPAALAELNYLALDFLLEGLAKDLRSQHEQLEAMSNQAELPTPVREILADQASLAQAQLERIQPYLAEVASE